MKSISILLIFIFSIQIAHCQSNSENRNLIFDNVDLKIIQKANSLLSDESKWNKKDDRKYEDDITNKRYSLYWALYKASIDIAGEYVHRRPAIQIVRFTLEKYDITRVDHHRLMDWDNHPATTFEEVKKVLSESINEIKDQL